MSVGWGQDCDEEIEVELWGECYNIEETTELDLSESGFTGEIPPDIGNLTNLISLDLSWNQLTGVIPEEICIIIDPLTINVYIDVGYNQLCQPYPNCISQSDIDSQETSNCEEPEPSFCDEGYTEIDSTCYYQSDLDVLQIFIDNSDSTINWDMDDNWNGIIEPLELGIQEWVEGRIIELDCSEDEYGLSGSIPESIGYLTELTRLK